MGVYSHQTRYFGHRIQSVTNVWATAVERAEIDWCTPHCLRHTGITEAVHAKGADVVDISRLVGHKNLKTTLGYIHVAPERLHATVAKMPKLGTL